MTFSAKRNLGSDNASAWAKRRPEPPLGRKVLFEGEDGAVAYAAWKVLGRRDADMMWCPGPNTHGRPRCPLVGGDGCDLVDRADVVINALGTADPRCAAVAEALENRAEEGKAVVMVCRPGQGDSTRDRLPRCTVVEGPLTRHLFTDSIERG